MENTNLPAIVTSAGWLLKGERAGGVPRTTLQMVHVRVRQMNGVSGSEEECAVEASVELAGFSHAQVRTWRDSVYFDEAERAALALTEAATTLFDHEETVPDAIWAEAAKHYSERGLAALLLVIGNCNSVNRASVTTSQLSGAWASA